MPSSAKDLAEQMDYKILGDDSELTNYSTNCILKSTIQNFI